MFNFQMPLQLHSIPATIIVNNKKEFAFQYHSKNMLIDKWEDKDVIWTSKNISIGELVFDANKWYDAHSSENESLVGYIGSIVNTHI